MADAPTLPQVMAEHVGHIVVINGWHERLVSPESVNSTNVIMAYAGFVVDCSTCGMNLSQKWQ